MLGAPVRWLTIEEVKELYPCKEMVAMIERLPDKSTVSIHYDVPIVYDKINEIIDAVNALELAVERLGEIDLSKYGV